MSLRGGLRSPSRLRLALGSCAVAVALTLARPARATLAADVETVVAAWSKLGQAFSLRPRLVGRGERLPVPLPLWSSAPTARGCTNVVFLTTPNVGFSVQLAVSSDREPETSRVGWAQVTRCGRSRLELRRLWLEMRSPRGVVETIVARSEAPLPTPGMLLAHRDPGPESALGQAGPAPVAPPVEARALAWEQRAKSEGAESVVRSLVRASARHRATVLLSLEPGCHRLSALALQTTSPDPPPDLDLVLRTASDDYLRGDQSENSDAELEACFGAPSRAEVVIPGLQAGDPAVLEHARFPMPAGLSEHWGPEVQGRVAAAFFRRRQAGPATLPLVESLGIGGRTLLPLELETHTCYVAVAAAIQGRPKTLLLDASLADRGGANDGTSEETSVAIAFCTGDDSRAQLRVESSGVGVTWLAALWRTGRAEPREDSL